MFRFLKRNAQAPGQAEDHTRAALYKILELNKEMARAARPELLPDRILDAAIELVGAERGFLLLRASPTVQDPSKPALAEEGSGSAVAPEEASTVPDAAGAPASHWEAVAARNIDRENVKKALQKISRSIVGAVLEKGEAFRSDDAVRDEAFAPSASVAEMKLRSVLCVPMRVGGEVRGAVYVDNRFAHGQFDESAQELLEAFADQSALALERMRLIEDNQRANRHLEAANAQLKNALRYQSQALDSLSEGLGHGGFELTREYASIIGRGRVMRAMLAILDRVVDGDFPVLLLGESGTGKELVAAALHRESPRGKAAFIGVNCGAIAEGLLESELFGVVKGAFTGAVKDRPGLIEAAQGGVLFLDEIGEMSLGLQAKLLRVLQERRVRRVGGNQEIAIDARIVSATNRDLAREVAAGRFREDLYYRLKVVQIEVPPLRERREDLAVLVDHFLTRLCAEGTRKKPVVKAECMERLLAHDWPGNVRELSHEITRMFALGGDELGPELVAHLARTPRSASQSSLRGLVGRRMDDIEAEVIRATLEATGGKRGEAAKMLGIPRRTFYNRLRALGID
ncbi:MAG TPA: sigma 54-interacting transcriptional regulator [Planctomycetota bacterium]|nr:sigma 54-interacting transcriptional regulator [Planctomycetota bacterium]